MRRRQWLLGTLQTSFSSCYKFVFLSEDIWTRTGSWKLDWERDRDRDRRDSLTILPRLLASSIFVSQSCLLFTTCTLPWSPAMVVAPRHKSSAHPLLFLPSFLPSLLPVTLAGNKHKKSSSVGGGGGGGGDRDTRKHNRCWRLCAQQQQQKKETKPRRRCEPFLARQNLFGKYFTSEEDVILSSIWDAEKKKRKRKEKKWNAVNPWSRPLPEKPKKIHPSVIIMLKFGKAFPLWRTPSIQHTHP